MNTLVTNECTRTIFINRQVDCKIERTKIPFHQNSIKGLNKCVIIK